VDSEEKANAQGAEAGAGRWIMASASGAVASEVPG